MSKCKRMTVTAIGIRGRYIKTAKNYNESECKNIPGNCKCTHAEIALLQKINPEIIIVSHSPCLNCAKTIVKSDTQIVIYEKEYRLTDGLEYLKRNNVKCIQLHNKVEKLTTKDIEDLMNIHADTYRRGRGGAIRRK